MVFSAIGAVVTVLIIVAFGFFTGYKGWANKSVTDFLSKLIVRITLPCTAITTFTENFDARLLGESWVYIAATLLTIIILYAVAKIVARAAKIDRSRRGVFTVLFTFSNAIFIGLPVAQSIFGESGMVFALLYYVAYTVLMNSIGFLEVAGDGAAARGLTGRPGPKRVLRQLMQPVLAAIAIGVVLVLTNVQLPDFLQRAIRYTGNITSPLALVFIGIVLQRTGLSCIKKMDKDMALITAGRFVIAPLIMIGITALLGISGMPASVLAVQVGLPSMTQAAIFAELSGADSAYATKGVVITTLLSFITIPIWVAIL